MGNVLLFHVAHMMSASTCSPDPKTRHFLNALHTQDTYVCARPRQAARARHLRYARAGLPAADSLQASHVIHVPGTFVVRCSTLRFLPQVVVAIFFWGEVVAHLSQAGLVGCWAALRLQYSWPVFSRVPRTWLARPSETVTRLSDMHRACGCCLNPFSVDHANG